ncbi:hypothetical protein OUY22_17745 [Nonomuraea sp. MCN248]|uniref:Cell division protein ZipA n=1 Tax=Nonomuraea corallina TaxID=2989783 RepID=A0ABT4SDL0_9ACTN|nr:hypothetical protein [Nonomuraea corallina]MDA0635267.1 hypothetical protein [Nonomuraea corallina]
MWIALAGGLAVIGVIVWSYRRRASQAEGAAPERSPRSWAARLDEDARVAFREGLRAYEDKVGPLSVGEEHGVLTVHDPPRLVSLRLLADRFAALGPDGLHDPEETVRELVAGCVATEQPGVLHLRRGWSPGPVDGMDRAAFTAAVREIVCPDGAEGVSGWTADEESGSLQVTVAGDEEGNTLLLDLARVLDGYAGLRAERPGMPAGALLRDVLFRMLAANDPGLTWTGPPAERHRAILLAADRHPAS